jgi:ribosomal protein S12 methylthiotransferase accessory factor
MVPLQLLELSDLVQPWGGLYDAVTDSPSETDEPRYTTSVARSGDLGRIWNEKLVKGSTRHHYVALNGSGVDLTAAESQIPALAEGLERYCTTMFQEGQFVLATAEELGAEALDLDTIPRCSDMELSDPKCPLARPVKDAPIRWIKGVCLLSGKITFVPAVLVYLHLKPASRAEQICIQITTGCAAHRNYEQALLGGILEVIERDATSITWLQKLPLARIEFSTIPPRLSPYWDRYQEASKHLEYFFFNATTDLGVPTIYGIQRSSIDRRLSTIVCCASALDPVEAIVKVMRDMASTRIYLRHARQPPDQWSDFTDLSHGALFMAQADQIHAFDFLTGSSRTMDINHIPAISAPDLGHALRLILDRFRHKRMDVYAVDLTSDEAIRAGMRIVRVVIPGLQPFSFNYRARYLGHKRIYQAPQLMGHTSFTEEELNPCPQPFA